MGSLAYAYRRMIDRHPSNVSSWTFLLLLWPLSLIYRTIIGLRARLYLAGALRPYRAAVPVISVGNLTIGGTGKTPVTDALAKRLLQSGVRVAVVSRGYGGTFTGEVGIVSKGDGRLLMAPQDAGDEPVLLAQRNPALQMYVARKRVLGVQAAERSGAEAIILDDGFQHLAVHREIDIVLLDSRAPFGNGHLLPAGPLREPPDNLRRAGVVIMTHALDTAVRKPPFARPVLHCRPRLADSLRTLDGRDLPWSSLQGRPVLAFAGIARPDDFFAALCARGIRPVATLAFNDHQDYSAEQLKQLIQLCNNESLLITTEKDAVKLRSVDLPCPCLVAPLVLEFDKPGELDKILEEVICPVQNLHHQDTKVTKKS